MGDETDTTSDNDNDDDKRQCHCHLILDRTSFRLNCSRRTGRRFAATLGAKNGVPAASYVFMKVKGGTRGSYSSIMIKACKRYGMKPVCDYPQSCKNDRHSLYIGQSQFLASPRYRNNNGLVPSGFSKIRKAWTGVCSYVRHAATLRAAHCQSPSCVNVVSRMHLLLQRQRRVMTQPRSKDDRCGVLFRTYAYPAPYPEDTRSTRIR